MNFGETIKNEIIAKPVKDNMTKQAFLSGIIRGSGVLFEKEEELGLELRLNDENVAMLVTEYIAELYGYDAREISVSRDKLNKKDKFEIAFVGEEAYTILLNSDIIAETEEGFYVKSEISKKITEKENYVKAFLRGIFVSSGSCTVPDEFTDAKTGYHLQIVFSHSESADMISDLLMKYGINVKIMRSRENYVMYLKSAEEIKDFIAFISTPVAVLKLTELIVSRDFINGVNRRKNCDLGNVNRQLDAAYKQTEAIKKLSKEGEIENLKPQLQSVAFARLKYPDDSIAELSAKLNLSKSCINHRLRKIVEKSKEIER